MLPNAIKLSLVSSLACSSTRRGIANAYGGRAMYANCEYILSGTSMGTGACLFSDGATFQLHFGS